MIGLLCFALAVLASPFKSKLRLEAEDAVLRHQLIVLKRRLKGRVRLRTDDRDRSGVSVWTTSLSWARPICAEFYLALTDGQSVCDAFELLSYLRRKSR